jgi:hypothetical protein
MAEITSHSIGIDGEVFEDRRRETRRRVFKGATVSFNRGYGAMECVVRNQSEEGARLSFGDIASVPPRFGLRLSGEAAARDATVIWRGGREIGVSFAEADEAA